MENRRIKILAIDDNKDNLISIKALIKETFPEAIFISALNGPKGIELAAAEDPDVILLDIVMPGMNGFEVCKKLKADKKLSDIPVVFVTAIKGDKESRIRALETGAEAFLAKPIDQTELMAQIRAMVKIKTAAIEKRDEKERLEKLVEERTESLRKELKERKQAEEALRESEERYRSLLVNLEAGIVVHAPDTSIVINNRKASELLGLTDAQMRGKSAIDPAWKFIHEDNTPLTLEEYPVNRIITSRQPIKEQRLGIQQPGKNDIVWVSVNGFPLRDSKGEIAEIVISIIDITERMTAELLILKKTEEIEWQNQRLESLLKISQYQTDSIQELLDFALNEAIKLTNSKIGYIYFYDETKKQFILNTWSKEVMQECKVMNPQTIYNLDDTGCWGEAVRQRKPIILNDYQADNPHKKGTPEGHVQLSKFLTIPVIFDDKIVAVAGMANKESDYDNSDVRQLTLLMDSVWKISERVLLIKDLTIAKEHAEESDRLKSAFLANMSHEIRTPMNGILGFAELLKEPGLTGEEQQKYIGIIEKSGARMLNIINDIVDISKIEAGLMKLDIKDTNINEQIEYIYTFFKPEVEAKGIKLSFKNVLSGKEAIIKTDHEKFYAIFTNLVKNAIKYSEEGTIELGYERKGKDIEFFVKDTGIGIPKDRQEAIFERFIQADIADKMARQGAGLGLAISKAYIEMLGGKIWVESEEGIGSAFYFTLPYITEQEEKKAVEKDIPEQEEKNKIKKLKTLIAEDDETSEMLITLGVEKFSKEILKVRNGLEAVEVCRNNPDIDLIFMDIQMPVMNGYEATRQIRQFNKDSVIIAQTAFGLSGDREKVIKAGCNDYISKPIKKAELQKLIVKFFGK